MGWLTEAVAEQRLTYLFKNNLTSDFEFFAFSSSLTVSGKTFFIVPILGRYDHFAYAQYTRKEVCKNSFLKFCSLEVVFTHFHKQISNSVKLN